MSARNSLLRLSCIKYFYGLLIQRIRVYNKHEKYRFYSTGARYYIDYIFRIMIVRHYELYSSMFTPVFNNDYLGCVKSLSSNRSAFDCLKINMELLFYFSILNQTENATHEINNNNVLLERSGSYGRVLKPF